MEDLEHDFGCLVWKFLNHDSKMSFKLHQTKKSQCYVFIPSDNRKPQDFLIFFLRYITVTFGRNRWKKVQIKNNQLSSQWTLLPRYKVYLCWKSTIETEKGVKYGQS